MATMGLPPTWAFSELYGFEEELLGFIPTPCVAVILNAEYQQRRADRPQGSQETQMPYYMKQTSELDNACGVIACLHSIYNNLSDDKITLLPDSVLATFLQSVKDAGAADRATALENYNQFKEQYRSVASQGQSS
eukprot:CAMPEP_0170467814 /NCGR_PEP_ID=MMETSP0123-20130129/11250_1 /TAXON_ID=182087 /ORGANISM="Favella ehrenbergii, Strain Fehren 1" /LENGTH=134 /DNA_ID=CAMNT_0010734271 /DNA_START=366 /DNA_END=770 /DNA_ORIENTATION=+